MSAVISGTRDVRARPKCPGGGQISHVRGAFTRVRASRSHSARVAAPRSAVTARRQPATSASSSRH